MWIAFLILGVAAVGYGLFELIRKTRAFVKDADQKVRRERKKNFLIHAGIASLGLGFLQASLITGQGWTLLWHEWILAILGAIVFAFGACLAWIPFYVHYYKANLDQKCKKHVWKFMWIGFAVWFVGFLLASIGVGEHLAYPLFSGITFGGSRGLISFFTYTTKPSSGLNVAFYGIVIIFGVLVVYWICDHEFFKKYGRHGILDSVVLVAFPAGIIGARIGYVIGNWNGDVGGGLNFSEAVANGQWWRMFAIWDGGLTILGGAIGGIIAGVLFVIWKKKYVDVRWAIDVIVPCILVAQAIGRWGNFFNHEVYGAEVAMADWWFLPNWIRNQMSTSFAGGMASSTNMYVPLFLIEGIVNLAGYFFIRFAVGQGFGKKLPLGSLGACYLIWYGAIRFFMEPLRDPSFNMGSNGLWSNIWSIIYIGIGLAMIGALYLIDFLLKKKAKAVPVTVSEETEGEDKPVV